MCIIEHLNWDSNFFGKKIGRVQITDEKKFKPEAFIQEAKKEYDLVYVFTFQQLLSYEIVKKAQLELADIMLTMTKPFDKNLYLNSNYDFRISLMAEELKECYEIAEQTSIVSRFYKEPLIGEYKAKELYRKWIDNALNQSFADGLFLEKLNGKVVGIHLIKTLHEEKMGLCSLIGVNSNYKKAGIGTKLWEQALAYWANNTDVNSVKVPFSIQNKESFNFHLKMGFNRIIETKYIYHFRNL